MTSQPLDKLIDSKTFAYHLENASFGVVLWNDQLQIIYCSKNATDMFGCDPGDLLEKYMDPFPFVHEGDAVRAAGAVGDIISGKVSHNQILNRNITKDGRSIYCQWYNSARADKDGKPLTIFSLVQDVTRQVEMQLALNKNQLQVSLAFNSAIDPMWLIRVEGKDKFIFETINLAFTKVTGWTPEQVEGQPIEKIMPAASHELVRSKYNEAIVSGRVLDYVEEAQHPSGIKYGEIRVIPIWAGPGDAVRILGIANDITEKVHLQKKLDAERDLRSRQVTAAAIRGQESERAKVSRELHDNVNQVLTTVKLYIELCIDNKVDPASVLQRCSIYLNDTINEIRSLSKQLSAPSLGGVNFKETISDLVETVRSAARIDVKLHFGKLSFTEMESELHLTLYRLAQEQLTNIMKYANAQNIDISLSADAAQLYFIVSDNGEGFDINEKRRGIGITNMQSRVEILNGTFQITSRIKEGTRMEVRIPIVIVDDICYPEYVVSDSSVA